MTNVLLEKKGNIAVATINRPKALNALNSAVVADLDEMIGQIMADEEIRALVITGSGEKAFVAGADIGEMSTLTKAEGEAFGKLGNDVFRRLEKLPIPTIAAVNGFALGGGCELSMSCDIRICADTAVFGQPETGLGITPGFGGTQRLARLVGPGMAKQLIYTAKNIKADEALRIGLVNAVYPAEELMPAAEKMASTIAKNAPIAVRACKKAINEGLEAKMDDAIVIEDLAYLCMDFRKPLGRPFEAPYQASVARYTDNYILLVSGSKIFSYAGQRIAVAAISDALFRREYPALRRRYNIGRLGDAYVLVFLYAASSGTSHSAQHALAAMFRAAADGELDFVGEASEYARRARLTKETFLRHGFRIVYDKDRDEPVSDGFFYTVGYGAMTSAELLSELLLYGICAISLTSTGSRQSGIRVCVSQMNRPEQFEMLEERLTAFAENNR